MATIQGGLGPVLQPTRAGTTKAFGPGNNLIGQQIAQSPFSQIAAQQGLQAAGQNFQDATQGFKGAGRLLGAAAQATQGAGQNLPQFQGIGLGQASTGLNQAAQNQFQGQNLPGFQGIGPGQASTGLNQAAQSQFQGQALPQFQGIGAGGLFGESEATQGFGGQVQSALGSALSGDTLQQSAQGQLTNILQDTEDARRLGSRDIGRSAAAFGRIGSGVVTTDLGNLEERLQRNQGQQFRQLAQDTAQASAQNQLQRAGLALGAQGQSFGQDLQGAGFNQGLRGEARDERGQEFSQSLAGAGLGLQRGAALQGLGAQQFGQGQALRGEARGERGTEFGQSLAGAQLGLGRGAALQGLGAQQFGQGQALGAEARGERGAQLDDAFRRAQLQQQTGAQLGNLAGVGGQLSQGLAGVGSQFQNLGLNQFDIGSDLAGQLRGERGFQTGLDQTALDNRIRQTQLQQGLLGSERDFQLRQAGLLGDVGFGGQPISGGDLGVLQGLQTQATGGLTSARQQASAQQQGGGVGRVLNSPVVQSLIGRL